MDPWITPPGGVAGAAGVGLAYLAAFIALAQWGSELAVVGSITPWYAPPGLSLALVIVFGPRALPALVIAEAANGAVTGGYDAAQLTVDALAFTAVYGGAGLVIRGLLDGDPPLARVRDLLIFLGLGALAAPLVAAVSGAAIESWAGNVPSGEYWPAVRTWFVGDAVGVVSVAPALLTLVTWPRDRRPAPWRAELVVAGCAAVLLPPALVAVDGIHLLFFAALPPAWIALRHGLPAASLAVLATTASSVIAIDALAGDVAVADVQSFLLAAGVLVLLAGAVISELERGRSRLEHIALHDDLTGLPNRRRLVEVIGMALERHAGAGVGVLVVDIDRYSRISDVLGNDVGEGLLRAVAQRLRRASSAGTTVGRLGRDRFALVLTDLGPGEGGVAAAALFEALSPPFGVLGHEIGIEASVGVAPSGSGRDAVGLLNRADIATTRAKDAGRGRWVVYDGAMERRAHERLALERDLHAAVERGRLELAFQPIVAAASGAPVAAEALVRWTDRERGAVSPSLFVPVAEETGLILRIGRWVIAETCRQAATWPCPDGLQPTGVSVNVSTRQLLDDGIVAEVAGALAASGLAPERLALEITETALMEDFDATIRHLHGLRELGVSCMLDDFGTGYASMEWLQRLPVARLKIDASFVRGIDRNDKDRAIVEASLRLAHALDLRTVAEGVESDEQRAILTELGCEQIQGYLVSVPLTPREFSRWLTARVPAAS